MVNVHLGELIKTTFLTLFVLTIKPQFSNGLLITQHLGHVIDDQFNNQSSSLAFFEKLKDRFVKKSSKILEER